MKIRFFYKSTEEDIPFTDAYRMSLFVFPDGKVWKDNNKTYESQSSVVGFEDCIQYCPNIGWKAIDD